MILFAAVVALALILLAFLKLFGAEGAYVVIMVDGVEEGRYELSEDREEVIETGYGTNTLVISAGTACISHADCPDSLCVRMGRIDRDGQSIICLPHHLVAEVRGGAADESDVDVIAR